MPYQRDGQDQVIEPNTDPFYDSQYNNGSWGECGGLFYGFVDGILDKSPRRVEPGVNWKGANLSCPKGKRDAGYNTQLVYARLSGASLERANLTGVNLAGADLSKAHLGRDLTDSEQAAVDLQWGFGKLTAKLAKKEVKGLILDAAAGELAKAFPAEFASATAKAASAAAKVGLTGAVDVAGFAAKDFAKTLLGPVGVAFRAIRIDKLFAMGQEDRTDLTNANLTRADLSEAVLVETRLNSANLTDANLNGAVMMAANVSGADFGTNGEKLSGVISSDLVGWPSRLPANWALINGRLVGPGANLTSADLSGADLRGVSLAKAVLVGADLTGANLTGVDLTGAQLLNADLTNANLKNANLTSADLTDVDMPGVKSGGVTATDLDLPADWTLTSGYLVGPGADLTGSNLTGVNFTDSILTGANLTDFFSVDGSLDGVRTGGIIGGEFYNPVNGQILGGRGPGLRNANLDGVDLSRVDLVGTRSGGITGTPSALPPNWQLVSGFLVGPGADFSGANLDGVDLRTLLPAYDEATGWSQTAGYTANPSGAAIRFITTKYGGISGTPLLPAGWRVVNGRLAGPYADLRNADLAGASVSGLNLQYALLSGVRSGGVTGAPISWPTNYGLVNGYVLGPNVNPREDMSVPLDLGSAPDLRGILLAGANLGKVNYSGVNYVFEPASAAFDYKVIPTFDGLAYLAGPGANLSGAHINCAAGNRVTWLEKKMKTKYNLNIGASNSFFESGAGGSLEGVNFRGATIENCSFSGLNLANSNWTEATVKNGRFNGTVFDGADLTNADFTESDFIAVADLTNVGHMEGIKTILSGLEVWSKVSNWWKDSSQVEQPGNLFAHLVDCGSGGFGSPVLSAITCGGISLPTLPGTTWDNRETNPPWKVTHINSAAERLLDLAATILGAYTGDVFQIIDALTKQGMSLAGPAPAPTNVKALPVMGDYCTGECANTSLVNQRVAKVYFSEPKSAFPAVDKYVVVSCSDDRVRRRNPRCGYVGEGTSSPILFSTDPGVQEIRVYSVNAQGGGPLSDPSQISLYAPPREPNYSWVIVSGRDDSTLKFRVSDFDPEAKSEYIARAAIKRFDVTATGGGSTLKTTVKVNPSATSVVGTLGGAVVGRRYTVTATATDVAGQTSKPSRPLRSRWNEESIVKMAPPGPVSDIRVVSSGGRQSTADGDPIRCPEMSPYADAKTSPCAHVTLSFRQAADSGGTDISRYVVSAIDLTDPTQPPITWCRTSTEVGPDCRAQQNASYWKQAGNTVTVNVGALLPGHRYRFEVAAASKWFSEISDRATSTRDVNRHWLDDPMLFGRDPMGAVTSSDEYVMPTPPGAPGNVAPGSQSAADGSALNGVPVAFEPADSNGSPVISYAVVAKDLTDDSAEPQVAAGTESPVLVTGLTRGHDYSFKVSATNSFGEGPESDWSPVAAYVGSATTEATGVKATAKGDRYADVVWTAPSSRREAVTGYEVKALDLTDQADGPTATASSVAGWFSQLTTTRVSGLTNGHRYQFVVRPTGPTLTAGESAWSSSRSGEVVPLGLPNQPTGLDVQKGSQVDLATLTNSITVGFAAPSDIGGTPITGYKVTAEDENGVQPRKKFTGSRTSTPIKVEGLSTTTCYGVTVRAVSAVGTGPASATSRVCPRTAPSAPTGVVATPTFITNGSGDIESQAVVKFSPPASNGGLAAGESLSYELTVTDLTDAYFSFKQNAASSPVTFTDLQPGHRYSVSVKASNPFGEFGPSSVGAVQFVTVGLPGAPAGVTASVGDSSATVSVTGAEANGSAITRYTVTAEDGNSGSPTGQTCSINPSAASLSCTLGGLSNGDRYRFRVTATNAVGTGGAALSSSVTPFGLPARPTGVTATPSDRAATVDWAPVSSGGSPITTYVITVTDKTDPAGSTAVEVSGREGAGPAAHDRTRATITELSRGHLYSFTVKAKNVAGTGQASVESAAVRLPSVPDVPTAVSATPVSGSAAVTWTAPIAGLLPLQGSTVTATPGGRTCSALLGTTTCTVDGLTNGVAYTFAVSAANALGSGASSLPSAAVTPVGKPGQADAPAATPLSGAASVAFIAPSNDGGRGITGYTVAAYTEAGTKVTTVSGAASPIRVTGLTNGTRYRFAVAAVNALGTSLESAQSTSVAPGPFPAQPLNVVAARDSGSPDQATVARVTFSSSSYYSPALIINGLDFEDSSHVLVVNDLTLGGQSTFADSQMCSGSGCGTRVTGLAPGHRYTFTVAARNRIGLGQVSAASAEFVAGIAPATPRVTSLAAGRDSTTVNFTDDTPSVAGLPIISYTVKVVDQTAGGAELKQVTRQASDVSGSGVDKSVTVSGLTAGRSYGFLVRATNAVGAGSWSGEQLTATPAVEATAPDGVAAVPNDRSATVTWSAPRFNGGSAITGYRITATPGGQTCDADALALSCQVGGLTNGTSYTFTVVANNGVGAGAISAPSPAVTPASVPSAPTAVNAVKGEGSATISWAAPASDGGSPLIGYAVTADAGNGIAAPLACTITRLTADSTSCVFTGLTGGISYTFKVKAINGRGSSDWSTPTTPLTAGGRSSTSGYIQAERGDASALVSFGDASSNGSPITTYTVTASPGGNTCTVNQLQIAASVRSCTVGGLTNGQSYTFTVTPSNEFGEGAASSNSNSVVPAAAPGAPADVTVTSGMASALVSFTAAEANGSAVVEYRVVANDLTAPERGGQEATGTGTSLLVSNLVAGDTYTFTVTARNAVGTSSGAVSAQAVPLAVPQAPTNVLATPGLGSASVSFDAATARGASITGYTVTAAPGGQTCQATTQARSCTVSGLTNGSAYTFTVNATSSVGDGLSSGSSPPVIPVGPPAAPTDVETAPSDSQSVYVTFAAPASNGSPITGYTVFAKDLTASGDWIEKASATAAVSTRVTGLREGHDYSFKVRATNAAGDGPDSIDTAAASTATVPGQADPSAEAGDSSVRISLTPPAANGSAIRQYTVKVYSGSGAYTETGLLKEQTAGTAPIDVDGLTNGTSYSFRVSATNGVGAGADRAIGPVTPATVAGAPAITEVARSYSSKTYMTVSYTAPASDGGANIHHYTARAYNALGLVVATEESSAHSGPTAIQFRDLAAGTPLTFTVTATNAAGEGPASEASTAIAPVAPPATPTDVTATGRDASALVTWTASAGNGDDEITYHVSGGGRGCETTSTQCLVSGLVNGGTSTSFKVYATNSAGWNQEYSALSNAVRASGLPSAPAGLTFTTDYPSASTFSSTGVAYVYVLAAPSDGGSTITGYTITARNASNSDVADQIVSAYPGEMVPFSDLIEGDQYVFTGAATNANGQGASTTPTAPFTWARRPDAPSRVSASAADGSASISFVTPPSHGSAISEYKVYSYNTITQQAGPTATGTESPLTVEGLTNGDAYTFSVKARNGLGESPAGTSSAVTPAGRPAVTSVSASLRPTSDGKRWARVDFSWNPAGAKATAYTLIAEDQTDGTVREFNYDLDRDASANQRHIHYFGNDSNELAWGHELKFRVVVRSALGASAQSDLSTAVTPIKETAAPTATATRLPGGARISIEAPNNGGSAITGYTVRVSKSTRDSGDETGWSSGGLFTFLKTVEVGPSQNQVEVTGLTADTRYRFVVCATNAVAEKCGGATSAPGAQLDASGESVASFIAADLPSTPTIQGVTRGDGSATVVVTKPAANGSAVTGYEVVAYDHTGAAAGSAKITVADPYGSASTASATISGLTGGETYTFKATATNAIGTSELSPASDPVTLRVVPDAAPAPQATAQAGDGSITVAVDTPIDGASVASFQVQFDARFASPTTFTWPTATAFAGCGKRVDEGVVIEGAPYDDFGNPCRLAAGASGSITQDGLINGGPYAVRVRALNSDGVAGPWKTLAGEVTPGAVPVGASATAAASTDVDHPNAVDVSWAAPNTRGSAISRVRVTSSPEGKTCEVEGPATGCTIDGLTPGTSYTFSVVGTNRFGDSAALVTEAASPTGSVDAPTGVTAEGAGQQGNSIYGAIVDVSWDAPENKGGLDLTRYVVVARDLTNQGGPSVWANASSRTARFDSLIVGRRYEFRVEAVYSNGWRIPSQASAVAVPFGRPDEPSYTALAGTGSATVYPSADDRGSAITGYTVVARDIHDLAGGGQTASGASGPITVDGLKGGHSYVFDVTATNSAGSTTSWFPFVSCVAPTCVVPVTIPAAPAAPTATRGNKSAEVAFQAPSGNGGEITRYTVTATDLTNADAGGQSVSGTASPITVHGLTNGDEYTFKVTATNEAGEGPASASSNSVTPLAVPDAPSSVEVTPDLSSASVSFTPSQDDNGSPITGYLVIASERADCTIALYDSCHVGTGSSTPRAEGTTSPITVNGLEPGKTYHFTVLSQNAAGYSVAAPSLATLLVSPPASPTGLNVTAGDRSAKVTLDLPTATGGSDITGVTVTATDTTDSNARVRTVKLQPSDFTNGSYSSDSPTFTRLTNGNRYTFRAAATNEAGTGRFSDATDPITPAGRPSETATLDVALGRGDAPGAFGNGGTANVTFGGASDNGSPITSYRVVVTDLSGEGWSDSQWSAVSGWGNAPGSSSAGSVEASRSGASAQFNVKSSPLAIRGLVHGRNYSVAVTPVNAVGDATSAKSTTLAAEGSPAAPTDVVASGDGSLKAKVAFTPPADNGVTVIRYTVTGINLTHPESGVSADLTAGETSTVFEGLAQGDRYRFSVTAYSGSGAGPESSPSDVITAGLLPGAPTDVAGTAGDRSIEVTFSAPADNGTPVDSYTVTATDMTDMSADPKSASAATGPITVAGLTNGHLYSISVKASTTAGFGPDAAFAGSFVPAARPAAPGSVVAVAGRGSARIWFDPAEGNGSFVTAYKLIAIDQTNEGSGGQEVTVESSPAVVSGLTNGDTYCFRIVATNAMGDSDPVTSNCVVPRGVPGAPTEVSATIDRGGAGVTFTAPTGDGRSPILAYTVNAYSNTDSANNVSGVEGTSSPIRVEGLTAGDEYVFTVVARNAVGFGLEARPTEPLTALAALAPGKPGSVTAERGDSSATVSWSAADANGSVVTGYTVTASPGGKACTTDGEGRSCKVEDLANGTPYTFSVVATNTVGDGESADSESVTPGTVAGAPTGVSAKPRSGAIAAGWTAPAEDGGYPITGYTATVKLSDGTVAGSCTTGASARTCDVTGLGAAHEGGLTLTVTATNGVGTGTAATVGTSPFAPTDVSASRGNASASVSWTAGTANGTPVIGYTVTSSPGGKTCTTDGSSTSCTVEELENGTEYSFTVVATSSIGNSDASAPSSSVLVATVPTAPQSVTATQQAKGSIRVAWERPASDGGAALTGYTATVVNASDLTTVLDTCQVGASANSCNLTGLEVGSAYDVRIVATNAAGDGAVSVVTPQVTVRSTPNSPTYVTASPDGDRSASVKWAYPSYNGTPATGYKVTSSPGGKTCTADSDSYIVVGFDEAIWEIIWGAGCSVGDLSPNTDYTFTVVATSDVGDGDRSEASNSVRFDAAVLGAPTAVSAVAGDASAEVSWTAPTADGGSSITAYEATASVNGEPTDKSCQTGGAAASCTVEGLANGTEYTFTVVATNGDGTGPASEASNAVTPVAASVPGKAAITNTFAQSRSVTVIASKPAANRSPITGYTITASPGGKTCLSDAYAWGASCEVKGLTNGTAYTFTVVATNAKGDGEASDPSAPVTPTLAAWAPVGVSAVAGDGSALVSWTADTYGLRAFKVVASPGGRSCETEASSWIPRSCTVDGLTNGTEYTFTVIATNAWYEEGESDPSAPVTPAAPATAPSNTDSPSLSGTVALGQTLTSTGGGWAGSPTPVLSYAWQRSSSGSSGWVDISGASSSTYSVTASDAGKFLRSVVTATSSAGSASRESAATSEVPLPGSVFVAPSGDDMTGQATSGSPVATLQRALDIVAAGGTVNVLAGTYDEDVTVSKRVTLQGSGSGAKTIAGTSGGSAAITVGEGASGSSVQNLKVTAASGKKGVSVTTTDVLLAGLTVDGSGTVGIEYSGADLGTSATGSSVTNVNVESGFSTAGIQVGSGASGTLRVQFSSLPGSGVGVSQVSGELDARDNWWNNSGEGASGSQVFGTVDSSRWIRSYVPDAAKAGTVGFWPTEVVAQSPPPAEVLAENPAETRPVVDVHVEVASSGAALATEVNEPELQSPLIVQPPFSATANQDGAPGVAAENAIKLVVEPKVDPSGASAASFSSSGSVPTGSKFLDIEFRDVVTDDKVNLAGPFTVCLVPTSPNQRLWHYEESTWVDITGRQLAGGSASWALRDTSGGRLCGQVAHFSPFGVSADEYAAPPTVTPGQGSLTGDNTPSFTFAGETGATFTCSLNGADYADCSSPYTVSPALADGQHTVMVTQTDVAGNVSTASTVSWTVDATAPTAPGSFTGAPSGTSNKSSVTVEFTLGESGGTVECKLDTGPWGGCTSVSGTSGSFTVSGLSDALHTVSVRQTDAAGNSSVGSNSWTKATMSPVAATLDTGSATVGKGSTIKGFGYRVDNAAGSPSPVFAWERCLDLDNAASCSQITGVSGANGAWWGVRDADIGYQVRLKTSWTTVEGILSAAYSALSGLIAPVSSSAPVLNFGGSNTHPVKGTRVRSSFGVWAGYVTGVSTVVFQWQRCTNASDQTSCSGITSAAGQWYKPTSSDTGKYLRVKATLTTRGQSVVAYSAISGVATSNLLGRRAGRRSSHHRVARAARGARGRHTGRSISRSAPHRAAPIAVAPTGVPGVPTRVVARGGFAQASVSWTAPASNGGFVITGYKVQIGSKGCTTDAKNRSCFIDGLTNGKQVSGTVRAINAKGNGPTVAFSVTPSSAAPKFTSDELETSEPGLTLNTSVTVTAKDAPKKNDKAWLSASDLPDGVKFTPGTGANANTGTITGQVPAGGVYKFTITASNAEGVITSQTFTLRVLDSEPTAPTTTTVVVGAP